MFSRNLRVFNYTVLSKRLNSSTVFDSPEYTDVTIPPYQERTGEDLKLKKARLIYQSRKRGMLENGLLLSTFADKYLTGMNEKQTQQYDRLINMPSNDWDIYYWATGVKPTPKEFDNEVMVMLTNHIKNSDRVMRIRQPDLKFEDKLP